MTDLRKTERDVIETEVRRVRRTRVADLPPASMMVPCTGGEAMVLIYEDDRLADAVCENGHGPSEKSALALNAARVRTRRT